MKKIQVYLPLFVIITVIGISANMAMPSAYSVDYSEQISAIQKDNMWSLGKNLSVGDSYTFKICDPNAIPNYSAESYHYFTKGMEHNSSLCYVVKLDFVNLLDSNANKIDRNIWVVQTSVSDVLADSIGHYVFHVDSEIFEVRSGNTIHPEAVRYAQSLQDTLFSIFKYSDEPKLLKPGSEWGPVTESLQFRSHPQMTVLDENLKYSTILNTINYDSDTVESIEIEFANVYQIGYDVDIMNSDIDDITTYYLVSSDIPFPLSGVKYSPVHVTKPFKVFEFELLSYVLENKQDRIQDGVMLIENNIADENILPASNDDSATISLTNNQDSRDEIISVNADDTIYDENSVIIVDGEEQTNNKDSDVTDDQNIDITINSDENRIEDVFENDDSEDIIQDINTSKILSENDNTISNQEKTQDTIPVYVVVLGVMLIVFASLFVYSKGFRTLVSRNLIKPKDKKYFPDKTISFDDSLTINIKTKKIDVDNKASSSLKANDYSIGGDNYK